MEREKTGVEPLSSGTLWLRTEPPTEYRTMFYAAIVMTGVPACSLVLLDGGGRPGAVVAAALIVACLAISVWLVRSGARALAPATMVPMLAFAALAMIGSFVVSLNPVAVLGTSVPFGFAVAWIRPRWLPGLIGLGAIAAASVLAIVLRTEQIVARDVVMMGVYFGAAVLGFAGTSMGWQVQHRLDQHHADQNELSLARERLRFASDLHDIQGHTLLAIKMKAELARRSLGRDSDRVLRELQDIEDLAAEAGDQTRDLAQGYRRLSLAAELANLDQLLSAAGIRVRIERAGAPEAEHEELFAALVREAASNILRHAHAERVVITLAPTAVSILNDGAAAVEGAGSGGPAGRGGSGLGGLEQRFRGGGGRFTWRHEGDLFTVTGTIGGGS